MGAIVVEGFVGGTGDRIAGLVGGRDGTAVGELDVVAAAVGGRIVLVEVVDGVVVAAASPSSKVRHCCVSFLLISVSWDRTNER